MFRISKFRYFHLFSNCRVLVLVLVCSIVLIILVMSRQDDQIPQSLRQRVLYFDVTVNNILFK